MSFPPYDDYSDSGIEWVGIVPRHWSNARLRWLTKRYAGGTPDKARMDYWTEGTIPWLNSGAVNQSLITEPSAHITEEAFANSSARWVPSQALVMALAGQGKTKGKVAQLAISTTCNQSMAAIVPGREIDARYLFWWLTDNYQNIRNMAGGDLRDGLNLELLGDIPCPRPPASEQTAIAAFVDRETAKIDALATEQQRLIELLKEKRQAVISHAVTKGLNPTSPMKETGVEWLGEVPKHWGITRIKHISSQVVDCLHKTPTYDGYVEYPAVRTADVERGRLLLEQVRLVSRDVYQERIQRLAPTAGDVLYSREGERFGMAALVPPGVDLCLGQRMMMFRVIPGMSPGYVMWTLNSEPVFQQVMARVAGATSPHVNISDIINFHLPNPPLSEQIEIAGFVERERNRLDALTTEAERAITLLQERRSALISAAVTGKIDVRGLADADASLPDVVAA